MHHPKRVRSKDQESQVSLYFYPLPSSLHPTHPVNGRNRSGNLFENSLLRRQETPNLQSGAPAIWQSTTKKVTGNGPAARINWRQASSVRSKNTTNITLRHYACEANTPATTDNPTEATKHHTKNMGTRICVCPTIGRGNLSNTTWYSVGVRSTLYW